jgi:hypothetical protein
MRRFIAVASVATATALAALVATTNAQAATEHIRITFDLAPAPLAEPGPWTSGCFADSAAPANDACVLVAGGGSVSRVQRPSGASTSPAVKFPDPGAGRAMLRINHDAAFNPLFGDFTITALVKLEAAEVSPGANLVQKGVNGTVGGQWKLQVDAGIPACRILGDGNADGDTSDLGEDQKVDWTASIAGAGWKFISCKRRGTELSISVANATPVTKTIPALNIDNTANVTIGAKGTGTTNDQFHGSLDNVVFSTG